MGEVGGAVPLQQRYKSRIRRREVGSISAVQVCCGGQSFSPEVLGDRSLVKHRPQEAGQSPNHALGQSILVWKMSDGRLVLYAVFS